MSIQAVSECEYTLQITLNGEQQVKLDKIKGCWQARMAIPIAAAATLGGIIVTVITVTSCPLLWSPVILTTTFVAVNILCFPLLRYISVMHIEQLREGIILTKPTILMDKLIFTIYKAFHKNSQIGEIFEKALATTEAVSFLYRMGSLNEQEFNKGLPIVARELDIHNLEYKRRDQVGFLYGTITETTLRYMNERD